MSTSQQENRVVGLRDQSEAALRDRLATLTDDDFERLSVWAEGARARAEDDPLSGTLAMIVLVAMGNERLRRAQSSGATQ